METLEHKNLEATQREEAQQKGKATIIMLCDSPVLRRLNDRGGDSDQRQTHPEQKGYFVSLITIITSTKPRNVTNKECLLLFVVVMMP